MHDILEGGLQYETKLLLQKFIQEEKYFTLQELNCRLESFEFGYAEGRSRPSPIEAKTLSSSDNTLKQNGTVQSRSQNLCSYCVIFLASQMWALGRYLPMLIGQEIPTDDEHWICYCTMLSITQYLFAPKLTENDLAILQMLIEKHHSMFATLYPHSSIIPKLHYLLHMPRLIFE